MENIEKDILKFLVDGKAYSTEAIMKNFGVDEDRLKEIYKSLQDQGYLETYSQYEERENKKNSSCGSGCGSNCNGCSSSSGCSQEKDLDKSKILVLTEKAIKGY